MGRNLKKVTNSLLTDSKATEPRSQSIFLDGSKNVKVPKSTSTKPLLFLSASELFRHSKTVPPSSLILSMVSRLVKQAPQVVSPIQGTAAAPATSTAADPTSQGPIEILPPLPLRPLPIQQVNVSPKILALLQSHLCLLAAVGRGTSSNNSLDQRNESRHVSISDLNSSNLSSTKDCWSRLNKVPEGGEDTVSRLADHQNQRLAREKHLQSLV
jgi:hypothetical protein